MNGLGGGGLGGGLGGGGDGGGLGGGGLGDGGLGATHVLLIVSHELAGPVVASVHSYLA